MTAKTIITDRIFEGIPTIDYIFKNQHTEITITADNYAQARKILNKNTHGLKGFKLIKRMC